jgi:dCTP diphosphatase
MPIFAFLNHASCPGTVGHSSTLDEVTAQINRFRDERDWRQFHRLKDLALSLSLEAAEVLELFQWRPDDFTPDSVRLGDELADVLYWTLLMAHDANIDLSEAFARKMDSNAEKYPVKKARSSATKYTGL